MTLEFGHDAKENKDYLLRFRPPAILHFIFPRGTDLSEGYPDLNAHWESVSPETLLSMFTAFVRLHPIREDDDWPEHLRRKWGSLTRHP